MKTKTILPKRRFFQRLLPAIVLIAILFGMVTNQPALAANPVLFYIDLSNNGPTSWPHSPLGCVRVTDIGLELYAQNGEKCELYTQAFYIPLDGVQVVSQSSYSSNPATRKLFLKIGDYGSWQEFPTSGTLPVEATGQIVYFKWLLDTNGCIGCNASWTIWKFSLTVRITLHHPFDLATVKVDEPFTLALNASGGTPPYSFWVTPEDWKWYDDHIGDPDYLPPGLTLDPATGVISGTPTAPGVYDFFINVADSSAEPRVTMAEHHRIFSQDDTITTLTAPVVDGPVVPFTASIINKSTGQPIPNNYSTIEYMPILDHWVWNLNWIEPSYVTFKDGDTTIRGCGSIKVKEGQATCYAEFTAGPHDVTAYLIGNRVNLASTSNTITYTPNCAETVTVTSGAFYSDPGKVTLEDAMNASNRCVGSTINFDGDYTIHRLLAPITVSRSAIIDGTGHNVTLTGDYGVINLKDSWKSVTLKNLTIDGATCPLNNEGGTMAVSNVTFSDNHCTYGGSIRSNGGTLTVTDSTFAGNRASAGGGAIYSVNSADVTVSGSAFLDNRADEGGGIDASDSSLAVTNSTFSGNTANTSGGGIWSSVYSLAVSNSTFVGNQAGSVEGSFGPAIAYDTPTVNLSNNLLYGNLPSGVCTGSQHNNSGSNNLADDATCDDAGFTQSDSIQLGWPGYYGGSTLSIPLLEGSAGIDAGSSSACPAVDQRGVIRPQGSGCDVGAFEYESGYTSAPQILLQPLSQIILEGDPVTFDVAGSGIPTPSVHWEMSTDSGATWTDIDGATDLSYSFFASSTQDGTQYRAVLENSAGSATSDAATFTNYNAPPCTVISNADSGDGTLRAWLADTTCSTITFYKDMTIGLASPLSINRNVTVDGEAHHITIHGDTDNDGKGNVALLDVSAQATTAVLNNLTLDKGYSTNGGAINNLGGLTLENTTISNSRGEMGSDSGMGDAVVNEGTLTVRGCTFTANVGIIGGAIANFGPLTVNDSTFAWNLGVFAGGAIATLADTTVTNSTFVSNAAAANGGAVYVATGTGMESPTLTLTNNTFRDNYTTESGAVEAAYSSATPPTPPTIYAYNNLLVDHASSAAADMNCSFHNATVYAANNLTDDDPASPSCPTTGFAPSASINLGTLGDNGGPVETFPLLEGSAAIEAGDNSHCPGADARGLTRPQGVYCDVGAFEVEAQAPAVTLQPLDQSVYAGDEVSFSAAANGVSAPSVHWQELSPATGSTWTDIASATNATLSLTPTYAQNGHQYRAVFANTEGEATSDAATLTVVKKPATVTLSNLSYTYDGQARSATVTTDPTGLTVVIAYNGSTTAPSDAGSYEVSVIVNDSIYQGMERGTLVIGKANATCTITEWTGTYDGSAHGASGTCTSVDGTELSGLDLGDTFTDAPGGTAHWTFSNVNYNDQSGDASIVINKAAATCNITGWTGTYDGNTHGAGGTCTGVGGAALSGLELGATFTGVPGGTAHWTFTDVTGNYNNQSGDASIVIGKGDATCNITGWTGTWDGDAHGAGDTCTGMDGATLSGLDLGVTFTEVPGGTAHWIFTDVTGNYNDQGGDVQIVIDEPNTAPTANPGGPYLGAINTDIAFDGSGSYDVDGDSLTYAWTFGDGGTGTGAQPAHAYTAAGVYNVCLMVNDGTVDSVATCTLAVVYDPSAGFVTGGGWIISPAGAYMADPDLSGKATFGFVSKYQKGATVPTGTTQFQFDVADFSFYSETYEWLVVSKDKVTAQFKGSGTVNGALDENGNAYKFMLWAGDGSSTGGADTFRIKIWWEADGVENVVYDNGFNQPIGAGNIVVHTGK